jgi:uncharacterized protein
MLEIGKYNLLKINKEVDFGIYLDGLDEGEILLPKRYVSENFEVGNEIEVFIYKDSEDRLIATTEEPIATVGEFAYLEVKSVNKFGAFLDWGLPKDLMVPFSEQKQKMIQGEKYLVYIFLDIVTKRIVASSKLDKFLDNVPSNYKEGDEVKITISNETDIGFKAIINNMHWGLLYKNEIFQKLQIGQILDANISKIRDDEKIDLRLIKTGGENIDEVAEKILSTLKTDNGFLPYSDKSDAIEIYNFFGFSKKNFKKAIGNLYKNRLIIIEKDGIRLVK